VYEACGAEHRLGCTRADFQNRLNLLAKQASQGTFDIGAEPMLVDGAQALIQFVLERGIRFLVCTGSLRSIAELELTRTGLTRYISLNQLVCADDLPWDKSQPRYWEKVLEKIDPTMAVGFEDRAAAAAWMLEAGIGTVVLLVGPKNSRLEEDKLTHIMNTYPTRVHLVSSWLELF